MANMMAALAMMMHMVFSQETDSCLDGSCADATSILQVSSAQVPCDWRLAATGSSCDGVCLPLGLVCDPQEQRGLQGAGGSDLNAQVVALGEDCDNYDPPNSVITSTTNDWAPYLSNANGNCRTAGSGADSKCNRNGNNVRRVCCCVPKGQVVGDPHIDTLKGEHYTLLKSGNFVAWTFTKAPVDWNLVAAYSGPGSPGSRFTTQSLLLVEKQSGQTMEISAEDCTWKLKTEKHSWRKVQPEFLSQGAARVEVQEVDSVTKDPLMLQTIMVLQMQHSGRMHKVARLLTHCGPKKHLNFKLMMYEKKDLDYVGGELGGVSRPGHLSFLSAKVSLVLQTDAEFQVSGTWTSLGGSDAASKYVSKQQLGTSLLSTSACGKAEEQEAEKICAKHLQKHGDHAEVFADCVYDVCHGGGEADALSAAAFISA